MSGSNDSSNETGGEDGSDAPEEWADFEALLEKVSGRGSFENWLTALAGQAAPPTAAGLKPLTELVDLAGDPNAGALACWYEEQIRAGKIAAYGIDPAATLLDETWSQYQPIPGEAWNGLVIVWWAGVALAKEYSRRVEAIWRHLHIADGDVLGEPAAARELYGEGNNLHVTFSDAFMLVQRWRERAALPDDYPWQPEEFFNKHPDLWPSLGETASTLEAALRDGNCSSPG